MTENKINIPKDRFRRDLGGIEEAYHEVYRRVLGFPFQPEKSA